jgi:hypothetical protein
LVELAHSQVDATNNATVQAIRIFTQHYKTFCGFESIDTTRLYPDVFEKVYCFTPFSDDAQERIRGKCLPRTGWLSRAKVANDSVLPWLGSPVTSAPFQELVPNV